MLSGFIPFYLEDRFIKYLLSTYQTLGTVPGPGDKAENRRKDVLTPALLELMF